MTLMLVMAMDVADVTLGGFAKGGRVAGVAS